MADAKLLSFLAMEFADDYGQEFFFQDGCDDSLALAMAAVDDNIITFKYLVHTGTNKTSIFRTQRRFFSAEFADGSEVSDEKLDR